uniref:VPS9 domain-containing protein n=1 Tax=Palpitomonas bilix TaxID=652834 RepID=A0A7S3DK11_9EUKA|mmetsp:Transcript_4108/g.8023  ORF Transcript_4108/g.8023 Transcript_4108/m.8023 type:complete len:176 (+) Transcript_4108:626-1153(+)
MDRMAAMRGKGLAAFGVKKLCLLCEAQDESADRLLSIVPYESTIKKLRQIGQCTCPRHKVDVLRSSMHSVSTELQQYWQDNWTRHTAEELGSTSPFHVVKKEPEADDLLVGADDLLPVLCYTFVQAFADGMSDVCLPAEVAFLEVFTNEEQLLGDAGYCLATLSTIVNALNTSFI